MTKRKMTYLGVVILLTFGGIFTWNLTARAAYESAEYAVVETDGPCELRDYPDLMLVSTDMRFDSQGSDGSFMRLFGYISGENEPSQKVAMTTPVFMEPEADESTTQMGFVIPKRVAEEGIPEPTSSDVEIRKRLGGKFAVVRFAGQLNETTRSRAEQRLRAWMAKKSISGIAAAESAGYDPPYKPGFLRRNEVLIRLE